MGPAQSAGGRRAAGSQRAPLSRDAIRRAALAIADRDGLGGLTIRKIASALDVSPMAVYRHFASKAEIVEGLVDMVVGDTQVTNHDEPDWRDWLRETFLQMRAALLAHPGLLPLLGAAAFSGTHAVAVLERVLRVMRDAGAEEPAEALFHTLMSYTVGAVALANSAPAEPPTPEATTADTATSRRSPSRLELFTGEEQFLAGFDRILR